MIINSKTIVIGLIGHPLGHSLSPLMHNSTLDKLGLNYIYLPFDVAPNDLGEAVAGLKALNIRGVNVTIPYKKAVIQYLDELSPEARACGAVNLIKNHNGRLTGYNTDGRGFMASLREEGVSSFKQVLIIGAGGAAQSLVYELTQSGAEQINILDIDHDKALELASFVNQLQKGKGTGAKMDDELFISLSQKADLVVNCTPVGMSPHNEGIPVTSLSKVHPEAVVYDLIYNPLTTRFLAMAQERNLKTINGLSMLVHQGALTLGILTGVKPPVAFMKEVVLDSYSK